MRIVHKIAFALAALAMPLAAQAPTQLQPKLTLAPKAATAAPAAAATPAGPATLTKSDVDAWLDGFVPYAIASGEIPGAVVVVVKDGQVLTQRGFGYADKKARLPVDPDRTLFRPGSTSKLFTWTAVMQQVQAGKLDLDRDINDYLDFKIPPAFGKPITLRNLMTHTAGFEETVKYLITSNPKILKALGPALKRWTPNRIFAPGEVPAYSNYGASLAGYIVERVSGEPFDTYIENHIFNPLGMKHSTFRQPLPAQFVKDMSKGYEPGSDDAKPYEMIPLSPAGALASTGTDMAKFMIAQLANGGPLLNPATAALMHTPQRSFIPGLPTMALGFYHEDRNGQTIVGHGGDTVYFHSDLHLYLDSNVGFFVSFNSPGKNGAAHIVRARMLEDFTDRYFPVTRTNLPTAATAKEHGAAMVGHYVSTRGAIHDWLKFIGVVSETTVALNPDNTITASSFVDAAGNPKKWREVGPWQWQQVGGNSRLHAAVKDGKVTAFLSDDLPQILLYTPAPASMNAAWLVPALIVALVIMLLTALGWPVIALVRRNYGYRAPLTGRALQLHRATRITAWLFLIIAAGWVWIVSSVDSNLEAFNGGMDIWMRVFQLLSLVAIVGMVLTCWNAYVAIKTPERRWTKYVWAVLVALAALFLVWLIITMKLLTVSLDY
ncbi:serine hydrolase domain-containing protein [Sphingomonas crusticola]|uniref:serine hydrolase domain-containing protein n=1 Tax=Sphingomonas crusticola TaxID=1697973 RepID=UPI000E21D80D|nr:serine hydrolase domain-containing protein [Sphingomonas crusticola]